MRYLLSRLLHLLAHPSRHERWMANLLHHQRSEWQRGVEQSCVREWPVRKLEGR